jgi:hypothetical protein
MDNEHENEVFFCESRGFASMDGTWARSTKTMRRRDIFCRKKRHVDFIYFIRRNKELKLAKLWNVVAGQVDALNALLVDDRHADHSAAASVAEHGEGDSWNENKEKKDRVTQLQGWKND